MTFTTQSGLPIATGFSRLVIGDRGPYLEFDKEHLVASNLFMPDGQRWRIQSCAAGRAYYLEYRTVRDYVKIYYQRRTVTYADYRVHKFYISPDDLTAEV